MREWNSVMREWNSVMREWNCVMREWNSVMHEWNCVMREWNSVMHVWNSVMHEWNSVMHEWNSVMREWNCVMHEWNSVMHEWNSVMRECKLMFDGRVNLERVLHPFNMAAIRAIKTWVLDIIQELMSDNSDSNSEDSVLYRVDCLYNTVVRYDHVLPVDNRVVNLLREVRDCLSYNTSSSSAHVAAIFFTGTCGRPRYLVPQEQLEFLVERCFNVPQMSALLGVSSRTIERRLSEFGIRLRQTYSCLSDVELDLVVQNILSDFPNTGYKRMTGLLLARGIRIQQSRIRSSMRRVNPEGCALRSLQLNTLHRRRYQVYGPLALWHIDGNHKLIR